MTTNRLAKSETKVTQGSVYSAGEYALRAEAEGQHHKAKLWRDAERNGWDAENYDPVAASEHKAKIAEKRRSWGGGPA